MEQKNNQTKPGHRSSDEWKELVNRYFDAQTTEAEELLLRRFLVTEEAVGDEFEEARAVMGFLAVGKSVHQQEKKKRSLSLKPVRWVAAAVACCIIGITAWQMIDRRQNVCVAYIYGEKCTDAQQVMSQLKLSLRQVNHEEQEVTVEDQLGDIFRTLEDEDATTTVSK
ncbi:hypothetical protein [Phocaeicola sp.]